MSMFEASWEWFDAWWDSTVANDAPWEWWDLWNMGGEL